jgi:hypothetical protein
MRNLEEEQRKMRERMAKCQPKAGLIRRSAKGEKVETSKPLDHNALLKRIADLEAENASLKFQLAKLSRQPRPPASASDLSENERRHLFMKYSNVRRY